VTISTSRTSLASLAIIALVVEAANAGPIPVSFVPQIIDRLPVQILNPPPGFELLFSDYERDEVHLSAFGLSGHGFGYFIAGTTNGPLQFGNSQLCVGRPQRISPPLHFGPHTDRVYASAPHPDPTSPLSTVFQFLYVERGPVPHVAASVARIVD